MRMRPGHLFTYSRICTRTHKHVNTDTHVHTRKHTCTIRPPSASRSIAAHGWRHDRPHPLVPEEPFLVLFARPSLPPPPGPEKIQDACMMNTFSPHELVKRKAVEYNLLPPAPDFPVPLWWLAVVYLARNSELGTFLTRLCVDSAGCVAPSRLFFYIASRFLLLMLPSVAGGDLYMNDDEVFAGGRASG